MNRIILALSCLATCCCAAAMAGGGDAAERENLLVNGGFERPAEHCMDGWDRAWSRDANAVTAVVDLVEKHGGDQAVRIEHTGRQDWSFAYSRQHKVVPGEIYESSAWLRVQGEGNATLGVVTRDAAGKELQWVYGARTAQRTKGWVFTKSRFVVPAGVATIWPRLTGCGPATVWCDDFSLTRQGSIEAMRTRNLPAVATIQNEAVDIAFHPADARFEVKDRRSDRTWIQHPSENPVIVLEVKRTDDRTIDLKLLDPLAVRQLAVQVTLDENAAEVSVRFHAEGEMDADFAWPAPFASAQGQSLILPVNEGISYPVDDASIPTMHHYLYGGHGLCMPWYGVTDGDAAWMAIVETPDDAAVSIPRRDGLLALSPVWEPQKQHFGDDRVIRYAFFDKGGYVAMADRYREYAKNTGLFKTLAEKRAAIPAVDRLVGAVNIWCWEKDAVAWCRDLQALGIRRILWSNALPPDQIKALNELGVLTSRYDIYQDAMNPEFFPRVGTCSQWTSDAWKNDDLMTDKNGDWVRGWQVKAKDGEMIACGTLCDRQAVAYAKRRIPPDLAEHPYGCRFLDTTTASPWRECYHPKHPMTRTESKQFKMELLRYVSEGCGLVCGSETGHDAAVPFVQYFEGMLSLANYRVPDSGRDIQRIWDEVPEPVAKFQTGHFYRLPLWELVYHDCVVAHWYWGDYNNKLPKVWDRRDLWNALYGTPPMFMFDRKIWDANKDRFVKSYQTAATVARATGYSQMLSHAWLTPDRTVQQTRFANGVIVTVNFGDKEYPMPDGPGIPPLGCHLEGMPATE